MIRRLVATTAAAGIALGLAACAPENTPAATDDAVLAGSDVTVDVLPERRVAGEVPMRLADDLAPPTNRWYSGLVFGADPQPVFPFPLAFATDGASFTVDLPEVTASATTIAAPFAGGLPIALDAERFEVTDHDPVSVTLEYRDAGDEPVAELLIAEGLPVVTVTAARDITLALPSEPERQTDALWSTEVDATTFGIRAPGADVDGPTIALPAGATAQVFAVPDDSDALAWAEALGDPVTGVETTYDVSDDTATTRLSYTGADTGVLVPFPGREGDAACDLGTFETAYGTARACAATELRWSVDRIEAASTYDFGGVDAATAETLRDQVAADLGATAALPADTYFGGKALARLATLLLLARALDDADLAGRVADRLWTELEPWVDESACTRSAARCFVYDDALRLVVGETPSFGSEEGNDHHFHYGYFLTAAAALAAERPELVDRLAPVMDLLAADIAGGAADGALPALRVFDPYRGHSWASGFSPFADGNNQESSSEAVAAWNGLALWARERGDDDLAARAHWLLSAEADAARTLWVEPEALPAGYDHGIVSLNWGGKRDYATWFSPEPSAILGIQVIPLGPFSLQYLASDPARVEANVAEAGGTDAFAGLLGDQVLQYSALGGADALAQAQAAASALADDDIDDGGSRAAILAWLTAVELRER